MSSISPALDFFLNLAKAKTVVARRFDNRLSFHGLGFSDLMILYQLSRDPHDKMRRIDLAESVGLTASGVTRLLLPMEKIGLVKRETSEQDARVSYVALAPGGKRLLAEALDSAEVLARDLLPPRYFIDGLSPKAKMVGELTELLTELGKTVVY